MLEKSSGMSNPFDQRELLAAHFGFSERSVDDVIAEQKARHDKAAKEAEAERKTSKFTKFNRGQRIDPPVPAPKVPEANRRALDALMDQARQVQAARSE